MSLSNTYGLCSTRTSTAASPCATERRPPRREPWKVEETVANVRAQDVKRIRRKEGARILFRTSTTVPLVKG
jgi:hypothetical protein